jgi:hypothetical protein
MPEAVRVPIGKHALLIYVFYSNVKGEALPNFFWRGGSAMTRATFVIF